MGSQATTSGYPRSASIYAAAFACILAVLCGASLAQDCHNVESLELCYSWMTYGFCRDPDYVDLMKTKCRRSCGFCVTDTCQDLVSLCSQWAQSQACSRTHPFFNTMARYCRVTCLLCHDASFPVTSTASVTSATRAQAPMSMEMLRQSPRSRDNTVVRGTTPVAGASVGMRRARTTSVPATVGARSSPSPAANTSPTGSAKRISSTTPTRSTPQVSPGDTSVHSSSFMVNEGDIASTLVGCSFEVDLCSWVDQHTDDETDWTLGSYNQKSGNGSYAYLKARPGNLARLILPWGMVLPLNYIAAGKLCMSFSYSILNSGYLKVFEEDYPNLNDLRPKPRNLFYASGHTDWTQGVALVRPHQHSQVVIESRKGPGGMVMLDDLLFKSAC